MAGPVTGFALRITGVTHGIERLERMPRWSVIFPSGKRSFSTARTRRDRADRRGAATVSLPREIFHLPSPESCEYFVISYVAIATRGSFEFIRVYSSLFRELFNYYRDFRRFRLGNIFRKIIRSYECYIRVSRFKLFTNTLEQNLAKTLELSNRLKCWS